MNFFSKKSLGQNFLIDQKIINLIIDVGNINNEDIVLEVGPGSGNLSEKILQKKPKDFILIEKELDFTLQKKLEGIIIQINSKEKNN